MAERMSGEIEGLYEVFGQVPRPLKVEGCAHCVAPDEDRPLLEGPVRGLSVDVLRRYATEALILWGGVPEFRYFLPRLLELAAENEFNWPDPEIVFGKLGRGRWTEWSDPERAAVRAFLTRWWETKVDDEDAWPDIGAVLCSLGLTGIDLVPFLDRWGRLGSSGAIRNLHEFVTTGVTWRTAGPKLGNPFWEKETASYRDVIAWLTDGRALTAVEQAFLAETQEEMLTLLDETHSALTR
ncbi:hypothetical protein E1293_29585 [Actinomadura darangshiensis]|uniref:Uncharacterized protein n=1 Tax=Actinomadura darangshiensis TaxID=705336 RepID=A0A4R5AR31_9ACTN|nr:hypothetical protein [Actinomadura darangshiensis]TDD74320.1 hypothetical protein E1293_29585 [Actinomadura darangshiensis]